MALLRTGPAVEARGRVSVGKARLSLHREVELARLVLDVYYVTLRYVGRLLRKRT